MKATPVPDRAATSMFTRLRRLASNSGIYLAGDAATQGISLLLFPLYTRYLTPADYGILAVTSTFTVVLTIAFGLALHSAVTRLHFEAESEHERRRLYGTVLLFMLVVPAVVAGSLHLLGRLGGLELFEAAPYRPYLQFAVGTAYLAIFTQLPIAVYQARQQATKVMVLTMFNAVAIASLTVVFVVVLEQGVLGALRAVLLASGLSALIAIGLMARMSSRRVSRRFLAAAFRFSIPLVPHLLGTWVLYVSDRLILEAFVSPAELGLYAIGSTVGGAASFLALAMGRAFNPAIMAALKNPKERDHVPQIGTYWVLGLAFGCTALALFATDAIRVLAPASFGGATKVVAWIVFGYLAFGIYSVAAQGTWFSMRTRLVPALTLAAGAINVALNFALIPSLGIVGSAIATLVAFVALAIMQGSLSQRLYRIDWEYGRWSKVLLASAIAFLAGSLGGAETTLASLGLKSASILLIFPAVLTVLGFWERGEREFLAARMVGRRRAGSAAHPGTADELTPSE